MFPQSLMRLYDGVGGVFRTNPPPPGTERLLKFLCTGIFLKNNLTKNKHGKTTESPRLP
ncbi:prophage terminase, small subunit [Escherichia coli]|nr:prophage terminase, small subunit [Escherichia coli]